MDAIKVPTASGLKGSLENLGIGALGGVLMMLGGRILGPIGAIGAPLLVGSMLKNENARVITTLVGFSFGASLFNGGGAVESADSGEM